MPSCLLISLAASLSMVSALISLGSLQQYWFGATHRAMTMTRRISPGWSIADPQPVPDRTDQTGRKDRDPAYFTPVRPGSSVTTLQHGFAGP